MKLIRILLIVFILLTVAFTVQSGEQTIDDLTALGAVPATGDYFVLWDTSGSVTRKLLYSYLTNSEFWIPVFGSGTNITTGNGTDGRVIPASMNGMNITAAVASVTGTTAGDGSTVVIQVRRRRGGADADVLSTEITIDASEWTSDDGAAPLVINTSNDDLETGDIIFVDVDQARSGAAGVGLGVSITAKLP